jgi:hypothetical protein
VSMAAALDSFQAEAFTAIKVQIPDGSMEPDFPCGWIAFIGPAPAPIASGMAVCIELPSGVRVIRWFIRSLEDGSFLIAVNPFLGRPRLCIAPEHSRLIGVVVAVEPISCENSKSHMELGIPHHP